MRYLTGEEILILHNEVLEVSKGAHGVRDTHLLASIIEKPRTTYGGEELYTGVFTKAAVYLESIVNYHVFIDGNKRTGLIVCARFLYINGYTLTATNTQVEDCVISIATKKLEIADIASWLTLHSKKTK